jgi:hypothetical protein
VLIRTTAHFSGFPESKKLLFQTQASQRTKHAARSRNPPNLSLCIATYHQ